MYADLCVFYRWTSGGLSLLIVLFKFLLDKMRYFVSGFYALFLESGVVLLSKIDIEVEGS